MCLALGPACPTSAETSPDPAEALAQLDALQQAFQTVIQRAAPSVVGVRTVRRQVDPGPAPDPTLPPQEYVVVVNGCGAIVSSAGLILTNEHVIQGAEQIEVFLHDGQRLPATVVAADRRGDLAVIRVEREGLVPVRFCTWSSVRRGQWAVVLGNPFGLGSDGQLSVAVGVVANLGRRLPGLGEEDDRLYHDMIQTTAQINPGNSGGPLFNLRGEMIGVVTAMHARSGLDDGAGFAIPLTPARRAIIERLCAGQPVEYGYLGLALAAPEQAGPGPGACVEAVEPGSPADRAGIRPGDRIVEYEGRSVESAASLVEMVSQTPVGTCVDIQIRRGKKLIRLRPTLEQRQVARVTSLRGGA